MITYKQLVSKTMPPEKKASASRCIIGHYLIRPISNIISIPLIEAGVNPTPVTKVSLIPAIAAFFCFIFSRTVNGFILGWFLILIWNILDGVDGNIARYCNKSTKKGELWDATVGWVAVIAFYVGTGFAAYKLGDGRYVDNAYYLFLGSFTALMALFPRLIMHKKAGIYGTQAAKELKNLNHPNKTFIDIVKLILFNCISINGGAAAIFLICLLTGNTEECMWFCFVLNTFVAVGSIWTLLK